MRSRRDLCENLSEFLAGENLGEFLAGEIAEISVRFQNLGGQKLAEILAKISARSQNLVEILDEILARS